MGQRSLRRTTLAHANEAEVTPPSPRTRRTLGYGSGHGGTRTPRGFESMDREPRDASVLYLSPKF